MSLDPESITVGRCYLSRGTMLAGGNGVRVRRVIQILSDGRVRFEFRRGPLGADALWPRQGATSLDLFARQAEREVPCDWTPEREG